MRITDKNGNLLPGFFSMPSIFSMVHNRMILNDLRDSRYPSIFTIHRKEDVARYLTNPAKYEKQLRHAIMYIYSASSHFRRLIQYFVGLTDISYIIAPSNKFDIQRIDQQRVSRKAMLSSYRKVLKTLSAMGLDTQIPKILTVCFREDVFYGTLWVTDNDIAIIQLPSRHCRISSIENNVFNVEFNFAYFLDREYLLDSYPQEFRTKYEQYKKDRMKHRWIELDSPNSFAVKCNADITKYALPPFVGILRDIYELEDYKQLKLAQAALENYAMIAMKLPMDDQGGWLLDYDKAKDFWSNLSDVLPPEIGSVLSPMELQKISFERANQGDDKTITNAEQNIFSAAGVSSLLFNNSKASANALLLSIKADQAITFGLMKSIGAVINRFLQAQSYGKYYKITFLDVSSYNRKEAGDAYLKAASYGMPTLSAYAATQGVSQGDFEAMLYLETELLKLQDRLKPVVNSAQVSTSESNGATDEGGAPKKDIGELTDSGEQTAEDKDDWG